MVFGLFFSSKLTNFVEVIEILNIMKKINILAVFFISICALQAQNTQTEKPVEPMVVPEMASFGDQISDENALNASEISEKYAAMSVSDTVRTKFSAKVIEVCQSKGCWMKLELKDGKETMVRFKDYSFFMPKDLKGKEVIVNGLAFVEEMSVDDQRHYAEDAGKSKTEIAKISKPKRSFGFEADGVLIKQ